VADWDVVGTAPAQIQDPWAVRQMAPAPAQTPGVGDIVKGVGDAALSGASKVATGVVGAPIALANRLIAALSGGDPQMAADAAHEYVNRTFGYDTQTPVGKHIGQAVSSALAPLGQSAQADTSLITSGASALGIPAGETHGALSELGDIAGTAGVAAPFAEGAAASTEAAAQAANTAAAAPGAQLGFRSAENAPVARVVAGNSGKEALTLHNQQIGDAALSGEAGLTPGAAPNYDSLEQARSAPNAVYGRVASALPEGPLSPAASSIVQKAGGVGQRITQGTPDAQNSINSLKADLLDPNRTFTGEQVVNEMRGLRQEGYVNLASDDVSKQQLGKAQLDMSRGLEQHVQDTLPANADVSLEQLQTARTALAKNYAVQTALRGPNVDMQAIARVQRADPDLLTGPMKDVADFANAHPEVSSLPSAGTRYSPPTALRDIGGFNILHPVQSGAQVAGGVLARRALTGNTPQAIANVPRGGLGEELAPIEQGPPQPPPGLTASTPTAPAPAAAQPPGQLSLADLLSTGVEQRPAEGLSVGPMGAPPASGVPFKRNASHESGLLSLADDLIGPAGQAVPAKKNSDLPAVMSQGVPEGIITRTAPRPSLNNNASGESSASLEAINRNAQESAAGQGRFIIDPDGNVTPLTGVDAVDAKAPKGSVIVQKGIGSKPFTVIDRGGLPESHANGLVSRAFNRRPLGEEF
jgi:hypothetical protein